MLGLFIGKQFQNIYRVRGITGKIRVRDIAEFRVETEIGIVFHSEGLPGFPFTICGRYRRMNQTVDLVVRGRGLNLFEELYREVTILCFFPMPDDKRSLSASVKPGWLPNLARQTRINIVSKHSPFFVGP